MQGSKVKGIRSYHMGVISALVRFQSMGVISALVL